MGQVIIDGKSSTSRWYSAFSLVQITLITSIRSRNFWNQVSYEVPLFSISSAFHPVRRRPGRARQRDSPSGSCRAGAPGRHRLRVSAAWSQPLLHSRSRKDPFIILRLQLAVGPHTETPGDRYVRVFRHPERVKARLLERYRKFDRRYRVFGEKIEAPKSMCLPFSQLCFPERSRRPLPSP